jgi:outer membrane lipoprotein-sorting protein
MNSLPEPSHDPVARLAAVAAQLEVPPGPDESTKQRLVAAMEERSNRSAAPSFLKPRKFRTMQKLMSVAAVLVLMLGVWGATILTTGGQSTAFAAMIDRIAAIQAARFRFAFQSAEGPNDKIAFDSIITLAHPWVRMEATFNDKEAGLNDMKSVRIYNSDQQKVLTLFESLKTAQLRPAPGVPKAFEQSNFIQRMQNFPKTDAEFLGNEKTGEVECLKYRQVHKGDIYTLWINPATNLPVRIELSNPAATYSLTYSNFEWDLPIDPTQLTLEPPAGYKVDDNTN